MHLLCRKLRALDTALSLAMLVFMDAAVAIAQQEAVSVSGIFPHLSFSNEHQECGTGAVVPWAGRLWAITYAPHMPAGSTDKLYAITPDMAVTVHPESVGGTPANRMIHRESMQLFIGPYVIDKVGAVRVIPPTAMFGRLTGNARHLSDPARKIYYASMEEGFYEVDVETLGVSELFRDTASRTSARPLAGLLGCHGKGLYSGQGRLVFANNGEDSAEARVRPDVPAGCLAEWSGGAAAWSVVRRNQYTEVTGPGGIYGNDDPARDPVWSIGWDHRSLLLSVLHEGAWRTYRLPKASHAYDGAHGWNTEWPRIRDIGEDDLLMTMHGMFWRFPRGFTPAAAGGIAPRATYLKVIGDFCKWHGRLVFGCDDSAMSEFLNKRRAKGALQGPAQSHSNLWFVEPSRIDRLGPALGRGAVWLEEGVTADTPSDPFLFAGFDRRMVHLAHDSATPVRFTFEVDAIGNGTWLPRGHVNVGPHRYAYWQFPDDERGAWVRVRTDKDAQGVTVYFNYTNEDQRGTEPDPMFAGLTRGDEGDFSNGLVRVRGANPPLLGFAARSIGQGKETAQGYYTLDEKLRLRKVDDAGAFAATEQEAAIPQGVLAWDAASVLYVDDAGNRWRLPRGDAAFEAQGPHGLERIDREVVTERDLFNCGGIFYELPAENAGGFAKIRPIATHNLRIMDYCSYRGMLVMAGVAANAPAENPHILRSDDGQVALWAGVVDDLWGLGKPRGVGGPWLHTRVEADAVSDPYLMTGFDKKTLTLSSDANTTVSIEIDIDGTGNWQRFRQVAMRLYNDPSRATVGIERVRNEVVFPDGFQAYWVRLRTSKAATLSAQFAYE